MDHQDASWDHAVDVLVVGSGNGGLTAAVANHEMGSKDVLVIEKADKIGGTSATSGGGIWVPVTVMPKKPVLRTVLMKPVNT